MARASSVAPPVANPGPTADLWTEVIEFTPDLAVQRLEQWQFDEQRVLKEWHIEELVWALKNKTFKSGAIEVYHWGGREFLTDGQYRLTAIGRSGIPAILAVLHIAAHSYEEVKAAYYRTDANLPRTLTEALPLADMHQETGLGDAQAKAVVRASQFVHRGFLNKAVADLPDRNVDVRLRSLRRWSQEAQSYFKAIADSHEFVRAPLLMVGPMAVGLVTFRYEAQVAETFWRRTALNEGLCRGEAEYEAVRVLGKVKEDKPSPARLARLMASCWNARLGETEIQVAKCWDEKKPILIAGTPYDGKARLVYDGEFELGEEPGR